MTNRDAAAALLGYGRAIADAIDSHDDALFELVENFMRSETGGVLDALSSTDFELLARRCMTDVLACDLTGAVDGVTLARYCQTMDLTYPDALDTVGAGFAIELG